MTGTSSGTLLDGLVSYAQPAEGYRTGIEPVLLAATVPAVAGDRVLEGGTGAGAGLLTLAARVPGIVGVGLEIDPAQAEIAMANLAANGQDGLRVETADLCRWLTADLFDHGFANPPWHPAAGTPSPVEGRRRAKQAGDGLLFAWTRALSARLRRRGTLSLILPAASLGEGVSALVEAGCPELVLLPLWPRAGVEARLVILRGVKSGRGGCVMRPGLVLHEADGRFTEAAEAILRGGKALV